MQQEHDTQKYKASFLTVEAYSAHQKTLRKEKNEPRKNNVVGLDSSRHLETWGYSYYKKGKEIGQETECHVGKGQ